MAMNKLLQLYIGCSGWSYSSWQGPFYPSNLENKHWLSYYSQVFNYVEVDSTFYRIPNELMVKNWARKTPLLTTSGQITLEPSNLFLITVAIIAIKR
jgi:hypothetical protein